MMTPTFLQRRRPRGQVLRLTIILGGLILLLISYGVAISMIIADRAFTKTAKLMLISFTLIAGLFGSGLLERFRR